MMVYMMVAFAILGETAVLTYVNLVAGVTALVVAATGIFRYRNDRANAVDKNWASKMERVQDAQEETNALVRQDNVALRTQVTELRDQLRETREELRSTEETLGIRTQELRVAERKIEVLELTISRMENKP